MTCPPSVHQEYEISVNLCWMLGWIAFVFGILKQTETKPRKQPGRTEVTLSLFRRYEQASELIPICRPFLSVAYKLVQSFIYIYITKQITSYKNVCFTNDIWLTFKINEKRDSLTSSSPHPVGINASILSMMSLKVIRGSATKVMKTVTNDRNTSPLIILKKSWKFALNRRLPTVIACKFSFQSWWHVTSTFVKQDLHRI